MSLGPQSRWKSLGVFLSKVYSQWHNILEKEEKYFEREYHTKTLTKAPGVIKQFERGQTMIHNQAEVTLNDRCKDYNSLSNITSSTSLEKQGYLFVAIEKIYFMKMIQMMQIKKNTILCYGKLQIIAPISRNTCQNL